jgi:hypothetical protein
MDRAGAKCLDAADETHLVLGGQTQHLSADFAVSDTVRAKLDAEKEVAQLSAKGKGLVFVEPKSANSRRGVKLSRVAVELLREHRTRQVEERLTAGPDWSDQDLIFCTPRGLPLGPSYPNKVLNRILARAGL